MFNEYHAVYQSDRYGFNNPDKKWKKEIIDYMLNYQFYRFK